MKIVDILTYPQRLPQKPVLFIIGLFMALGFCLQNAQLIPGLGGEYQPLIYLLGCFLALACLPIPRPALYASATLLATSALAIVFHRIAYGAMPSLSDALRLAVGPLMMAGTAAAWNRISAHWLWGIIIAYLGFALWGTLSPDSALNLIALLGVRVNDPTNPAYFPWSAFFYSEYSYSALAIATIFTWINAREETNLSTRVIFALICSALEIMTRSGTGFAMIIIIAISLANKRTVFIGLAVGIISFFISPRVQKLFLAIASLLSGNFDSFISIDPGTSWRFLANFTAWDVILRNPVGLGTFDMRALVNPYSISSLPAQDLFLTFLKTHTDIPAQSVAFNFGIFGGWMLFALVCYWVLVASTVIARAELARMGPLIGLTVYAFFIQSALTCPTPWICLGILLSYKVKELARSK